MPKKGKEEDDAEVDLGPPPDVPTASFMVELKSFTLPPAEDYDPEAPAAAAPEGGDEAEGEEAVAEAAMLAPKRQFWAKCEISANGVDPYESWWSGEAEEKKTFTEIAVATEAAVAAGDSALIEKQYLEHLGLMQKSNKQVLSQALHEKRVSSSSPPPPQPELPAHPTAGAHQNRLELVQVPPADQRLSTRVAEPPGGRSTFVFG